MSFPLDPRVLDLLSGFDDTSESVRSAYDPTAWSEGQHYLHRSGAGDLDVTVWTHSGTAWVCLRGLLSRRAERALTMVLTRAPAAIVLNVAELTLPAPSGGTPLIKLCAALSYTGHSVAVVGRDDEAVADAPRMISGQHDLLLAQSS